ncbi:MaoC family dehydratase N-terminal domain-containing protein [Poseidonocella sp. HB161398]|uniref:FAS1-like dehydratase domain-containing protein n=1 Tax=Poseidonocella sp. HB161398 TaxID=2320855 RepID=UPI0011095A6C|nr:MaoC family dehydratase N-terminal domain-containing protein [Poseidonocella sp. HB161398]
MDAPATPLDLAHLAGWIGRSETQSETLAPELVQRFAATFDREAALAPGAAAPQLIHLCLCQPARPTAELGPDGHPARGGFLPPVPLPRRMWAGGAFAFHAPIRIGETVTRRSAITDVALKSGRSGPLCFVTVEHRIESGGQLAVTERQDIVYREAVSASRAAPPAAPEGARHRRIDAGPVLLFRYSALTFNGHRIHYDQPYVTGEEGYPGLIVHGPLQATLLALYAADLRGAPLARFSFRSGTPLFDTAPVMLNADEDGPAMRLWTARPGGPAAMEATAEW